MICSRCLGACRRRGCPASCSGCRAMSVSTLGRMRRQEPAPSAARRAARAARRAPAPRAAGRSRRSASPGRRPRPRGRSGATGAAGPARARSAGRRAAGERWASGGSPRSSHEPSGRRISSSRSASSLSAVETVGRRAPTSWPRIRCVSASGTITPSPETRPQRSARCQNSAFRRRSTRVSCEIACVVARRSERSLEAVEERGGDLGVARHLGREAAVEHGDASRREHRPDGRRRAAGRCGSRPATGARGRRGRAARR